MLLMVFCSGAFAQETFDARSVSMANSNVADAVGLEQIGRNPATLALPSGPNFEFNLMSAHVTAYNNSFNRDLYDRYFTSGETLSESDKQTLLDAIPGSGLQGRGTAGAKTLAFYMPRFSLALSAVGNGSAVVPRELAELALNGNSELGKAYDLSNVEGCGWGGLSLSSAYAHPIYLTGDHYFNFYSIGVSGKYISGLGYYEVVNSRGTFQNVDAAGNGMQLDGIVEARSARGGSGFAGDLGFLTRSADQKLTISAHFSNVIGSINWNKESESRSYSIHADSLAVGGDDLDSLLVDEESSEEIAAFSSRLPFVVDVGVAYQAHRFILVTAEYAKAFQSAMGYSAASRLAMGFESRIVPFLPIRGGLAFGGGQGTSFSVGTGIDLKFWFVDVGLMNHGGISGSSTQGLTLAATTRFRF